MAACRWRGLRVERLTVAAWETPPASDADFCGVWAREAVGCIRDWVRPGQGGVAGLLPRPRQAATPPAYASSAIGATLDRRRPMGAARSSALLSTKALGPGQVLSPQFVVVSGTSSVEAAGMPTSTRPDVRSLIRMPWCRTTSMAVDPQPNRRPTDRRSSASCLAAGGARINL